MKKSYIAGIALFVIAALFSLSLLLVLFDFGGMSAAHNSFFFGLGSFFANAYGVCSIFIPAFLIFAASHCFFTKWHFRTGVLLSGSVIPFFTLVGIEKLCRFFAGGDGAELVGAKIFITILIGLMIVALEFLLLSILGDMIERRILDKKLDEDSERPIDAGDEKFDVPRYSQDSDVSVIEQEELYPEFSSYQSDYKEENSSKEKTAPAPADEKSKTLLKPEQRTPAYIGKLLHDSIQEQNAKSQLVSFDRLADDVDRLDLSGKKNPYASIFDEVEKKKAEEEKKRRALAAAEAKKKEQEAHSEPILAPIQIDGVVLDDGFGDDEPVEEDVVSDDEISRAAATAQADIPAEETVPSEIDDPEDADDEYASYEPVAPSETPAQNEPALSDEPIESDETVAQGNPAEENIPSEIEDSDEPALSDEPIESDATVAQDEPAETDGADETFEEETTREAEEDSAQDDDFSAPAAQNEPNEESALDETFVADEADAPAEPSEPVSREMPDFAADEEAPAEEDFVSDEEISEATATAQADIPAEENIPSEIEDSDEPALSDEPIESAETDGADETFEEETTHEAEENSAQDDDFSEPAAHNEPNEESASDETYVADEADAPAEPSEPVSREMPDFEGDEEDPVEEDFVSDEEISEATATAQADIPAEETVPSEIEDSDEPALSVEPIESEETVAEDEPAETDDADETFEEDECPEVRVSFSNASVINDEGERFEIETDIPQEARRFGVEAEEEAAFDEDEDNFDSDDEDFVDEEESENDTLSSDDNTMLDSDEDEIAVADSDDDDDDEEGFPQTPVGFDLYDRTDDKIDVDIIDDSDYDEDFDEDEVSESEIAATIAGSTVSTAAAKSVPTAQPSSATAHPIRSWANYHVSSDLLEEYPNNEYWVIDDDTKLAASRLMKTLNEFKIEAEVTGICKGPVVTMFEILPAPGVKLNKIVALQDNIALALAARSVRIVAPIPGKHAVGIEVPNKNRAIVSFKEIIDTELPAFKKMGIPVILGKDISGDPQIIDIAKTPHLLIAGATGAGKSVCVNSMLLSILFKRSPAQVKLILVDPKIVELSLYNDIPHLLTPVITEPKRALQALQYCLCEMERRYALLSRMSVRDIVTYNNKIEEEHIATEKLPYIVVIIDEFADLMMTTGKELESSIARLAAKSRAVGIHLVLATQRPSIDVITGLIKANLPSRIAFMVASKMDSRIIIDKGGAETLLGKGDMLYSGYTTPYPVRIQGTLVSDEEVENVVEYVKSFGEPDYIDDEMFIDDDDDGSDGTVYREDGQDPLYDQALEIVIQAGKASASYIQRKLSIGYNRAARLVEEMEERGIVGPQNGSKPREIIHLP